MRLLMGIMKREQPESAIIFCNTKRYTEIVAKRMKMNGYACEFIMGDLPQAKRLKIIDDIKAGKLRFLVATDVAARGLDIEGLSLVVNYDLPNESENYVHRIGRTARAGKTGKAITFASEQDIYELPSIEKYIGKKIPSETAVEELYAEDKSKGMRIQTDFYEDRGGGRRDGRRSEGRRGGGEHKKSEGRRDHAPRQPRERHDNRRGSAAQSGSRAQGAQGGKDISKLSFDERMAFYKSKYDRGDGKNQNRRRDQRRDNRRPNSTNKAQAIPPQQKAAEPPSQKKGILSKIFGVFKKKPH
jgi:ATP-dependent RNA helicase RhlB